MTHLPRDCLFVYPLWRLIQIPSRALAAGAYRHPKQPEMFAMGQLRPLDMRPAAATCPLHPESRQMAECPAMSA